jgi:hypothetical protein
MQRAVQAERPAERPMSLDEWYSATRTPTEFTRAFLDGRNLLRIQAMLTDAVRKDTGLPAAAKVPFDEQLLSELMAFAQKFDSANGDAETVERVNNIFVFDRFEGQRDGRVWDANQANFFQRWQRDGAPDPANVPLPISVAREDTVDDPSSYLLTHPWGKPIPRF